jgi:hypothetical protein
MVNKFLRNSIPPVLFQRLHWHDADSTIARALEILEQSPGILAYARFAPLLCINMLLTCINSVYRSFTIMYPQVKIIETDPSVNYNSTATLLVNILEKFGGISILSIDLPREYCISLSKALL